MTTDVIALLDRARRAPAGVSALDAVMGADWGIVDFDEERRPPEMRAALHQAHAANTAPRGGHVTLPAHRPQAVVKMVRDGGVASVDAMKTQMSYLSREGAETLKRSERFMGRCCRTRPCGDSQHESMRLRGRYAEALTRPLPHDELARL